ncbi:MAG: hypothetical protein ACE5EI_04445 [Thermodesulfobacteriota bacterium]
MARVNTPEAAARLARTIVSDIALYNKEKVADGIKNDSLFDLLAKELKEGLDLYKSKVSPEIDGNNTYYNLAIVDILVKRCGEIDSDIW